MTTDNLIDAIRGALDPAATPDARAAGAGACRAILTALEGVAGQPLAAAAPVPASPVAGIVSALRGVPPDQLLDLAIARLRAALPGGADVPPVTPLKFHIIQVPPSAGSPGRTP